MAEPFSKPESAAERTAFRFARFMARYGAPGAILAFLILRIAALAPVAAQIKAVKLLPVVLFCCYEVTWLFGWAAGALIILQYAAHELAHALAARSAGRAPGWYGPVPLVGPYLGARNRGWESREAEARVALDGQVVGLVLAGGLYAASVAFGSPLLRLAAFCGFLFNLVQLAPLRPFDGGRIFPGLDWPAADTPDLTMRLKLSLAFARLTRLIGRKLGLEDANAPGPLRALLGPALFVLIVAGFAMVAMLALILPPTVTALAILFWILATFALILFVPRLDARVLASGDDRRLLPRRAQAPAAPEAGCERGWASRSTAQAALQAYLLLVGGLAAGAYATWPPSLTP